MKKAAFLVALALSLPSAACAANLVWSPDTASWDFGTLNWVNTNTSVGALFVSGDNVRFDDGGLGQPSVGLGANLLTPNSVVVESSGQYTLTSTSGGKLTGATTLTKRGTGLLILDADNNYSGATSIAEGQLQIGAGASRGSLGSGPVTNTAGLIINRTGTLTLTNFLTGAGGFTNKLIATVNIWGTNTMSGPILVQVGILSLSNATALGTSSDITLDASPTATAISRLGLTAKIGIPATTTINLMGTAGAGPSRCSVQTVIAGDATTNTVDSPLRVGSGNGFIQLNAVSTGVGLLQINGNVANHPDNGTPFNGTFLLRGAGNGLLTGTVNLPEASFVRTDAGTFTVASTGNSWAGTLVAVGRLRLGADNALPLVPFTIGQGSGAGAVFDLNGFNQQLPGITSVHLSNPSLPIIASSSTTSDSILTLSAGGVYSGLIQDSISNGTRRVGITINNGAQQLGSVCTYSGPTTINGGGISLVGAGAIPNTTPIEIAAGAAIDVRSKSDSTLTLQSGQTLKGNATFKIEGSLTSLGTIELKINKTGGVPSNDQVLITSDVSTATVTYGGTLNLDLSGEPLDSADSFKLFDAGVYAGTFSNITPSIPGAGFGWNVNTLAADGTLRIVATNPTNLTTEVVASGTQLHLTWPTDHTGWTLQAQTNGYGVGLTANWHAVPGSPLSNEIYMPIESANGSVFYRLTYQP